MTYGISITSGFDTTQIDSNTTLSYLKVVSIGSAQTLSGVPGSRLVCIKPPTGANDPNFAYGALKSGTGPFTYNFYKMGQTSLTTVDYVILEPVKAGSPSPGYGLQVYNTEGELAFDSGIFVNGATANNIVSMVKVLPPGTSVYGNSLFAASILYTGGDYLSIYASINASVFAGPSVAYNGFRWYTDSSVRWNNWLTVTTTYYATQLFTGVALLKIV